MFRQPGQLHQHDYMIPKAILLFVASIFIGYVIGNSNHNIYNYHTKPTSFRSESTNKENVKLFTDRVNVTNIKKHLKYLTSVPHLAGTYGDKLTAKYVEEEWIQQGFDEVTPTSYKVLLDYPDEEKYNSIKIYNSDNSIETSYEIKEDKIDSNEDYSKISKPFLAYSTDGSFNFSELYYINYCSEQDFELFLNKTNISLKDKVCICKYGHVFRGNKVKTAEKYGLKAVLLYDDPYRCAPLNSSEVYPNGQYMPESGTQRGTINVHEGDPLTPSYPSTETSFRISDPDLPKIAAQVIGYKIAKDLFNLLDDTLQLSPENWRGQLNVRYSFGGPLKSNRTLTLNIYNQKNISEIHNVLAAMTGTTEPDRYIIIGNHRDSWTYGSMDPSLGTAIMLEVSRMLCDLRRTTNWKPRRSIIFESWSAEEYGLVGSTEWVEEFEKKLSANAVVYINLDVSVYGNWSYEASASPLLFDMLYDVTRLVDVDGNTSVYDRWMENNPDSENKFPNVNPFLGSGSDHMAFLQRAGVPCIDQKFGRKKKSLLSSRIGPSYPLYHTSYETYNLVSNIIDPGFTGSKLLSTIVAEIARTMASSTLLPFNVNSYANILKYEFERFVKSYQEKFVIYNVKLVDLERAIGNFSLSSYRFMDRISKVDLNNVHLVRQYNEQLRNLERSFLDFNSLKTRGYMHMIFAPSNLNKYTSQVFPSLSDLIIDSGNVNSTELTDKIKFELSIIVYALQSASSILKDPIVFTRYVY